MKRLFIIMLLVATLLLAGCVSMVATSDSIVIQDENTSTGSSFTGRDRQIIHHYYKLQRGRHKSYKTPPEHASHNGNLPYGLAKRDQLPPELYTRGLPKDLESQLTALPKNYIRVIVGGDVVMLDSNSRVVIDIYRNVIVD